MRGRGGERGLSCRRRRRRLGGHRGLKGWGRKRGGIRGVMRFRCYLKGWMEMGGWREGRMGRRGMGEAGRSGWVEPARDGGGGRGKGGEWGGRFGQECG